MKPVINNAPITIELVPSPPRKKVKETANKEADKTIQDDLENIVSSMKDMEVDENNDEIKEEEKIPQRLKGVLKMKGLDINEHKLVRVGGGGKCGLNCISLHTTGSEELSKEIGANKNLHIVQNWENIYKNSFEFPYTEKIGGGTRTFSTEDDFLTFLLTERKEASTMWMTHTGMQAVSTMLNLNISILTTGVPPPLSNMCVRCMPQETFNNEEDLRMHKEKVHHRVESDDEKEGRIQKTRWTHLRPDNRIRESIYNEKPEEIVLMHEDEVHYNLIVHKSHTTFTSRDKFMKHIKNDHGNDHENELQNQGWQTVGRRGRVGAKYNIPVNNKYEILSDTDDNESSPVKHSSFECEVCKVKISTKSMLKTHMKVHKTKASTQEQCNCAMSKEYQKAQAEIKTLRKELEKSNNKVKSLESFKVLQSSEVLPNRNEEMPVTPVRQSVISYRCKECNFICKTVESLNTHIREHEMQVIQCQICEIKFNSEGRLTQHMLNEHKERLSQLNCNMCSFQSSDKNEFINHVTKHGETDQTINVQLKHWKCRNCEKSFESKWTMMDHRRDNHEMPMCFLDMEGKCKQLPGKCWYKHKLNQTMTTASSNSTKCFSCKEEFASLDMMMEHRKYHHPEIVKQCTKFAAGECRREKCWFMHEKIQITRFFSQTGSDRRLHKEMFK